MLAGVALAAAATWLALGAPSGPGERVAAGESYDGDPIDGAGVRAGTDLASVPLTLRQGCAWGKPGRNPYQGTVEQALQAARLPPSLAAPLAAKIHAHAVDDRLVIATQGMRAERSGQVFSPRGFALSYGHTMCLRSRVNFAAGHVERADLYEVSDASGRRAAVMVPDVCGNVSVLGARGQRGPLARAVAGAMGLIGVGAHDDAGVELVSYDGTRFALAAAQGVQAVPEPGTLACVTLALAVLAAVLWHRRRRLHK
ncbi:MAG: PEP-CTERM sorting domain-containing protein [Burkholderiales bacterium]|nr:PEP-CTERM sorting domain-containing protein [Burkholderiales bacterium]